MTVGVLALQGNFSKHLEKLHALDCTSLLVKYPQQLQEVDGLVLPGGESTCMIRIRKGKIGLWNMRRINSHGIRTK